MNEIENMFYKAFLGLGENGIKYSGDGWECKMLNSETSPVPNIRFVTRFKNTPPNSYGCMCILPQKKEGRYTLDFAVTCSIEPSFWHGWVAVEIDGHEFHEKTKEQAAHDKKRDRYLTIEGYSVLRFTGSEVYADATACAVDIVKCMVNRYGLGI